MSKVIRLKEDYEINCVNCKLCFYCKDCEECYRCEECNDCKNCNLCYKSNHCNHCYDCVSDYCNHCTKCDICDQCNYCNNCDDCTGCDHCINCETCIQCNHCYNCIKCENSNYLSFSKNIKNYNGEEYLHEIYKLNLSTDNIKELLLLTLNKNQFNLSHLEENKLKEYYDEMIILLDDEDKYDIIFLYLINFKDVVIKLINNYKLNIDLFPLNMIDEIKI